MPILLGFGRSEFWQAVTDHQQDTNSLSKPGDTTNEDLILTGSGKGESLIKKEMSNLSPVSSINN